MRSGPGARRGAGVKSGARNLVVDPPSRGFIFFARLNPIPECVHLGAIAYLIGSKAYRNGGYAMAREKVGDDVMTVRFSDGTFSRIDAAAGDGKRSEFIRAAVEAALGGSGPKVSPGVVKAVVRSEAKPVVVRSVPKAIGRPVSRWASDPRYGEFRDMVLRSGSVGVTSAQVVRETGWTPLLVERFADAMHGCGDLHYPHGGGRMVGVV